jgi:hypothetical protein
MGDEEVSFRETVPKSRISISPIKKERVPAVRADDGIKGLIFLPESSAGENAVGPSFSPHPPKKTGMENKISPRRIINFMEDGF